MTLTFDDSHYDALILWAFDPPPVGRPGPLVTTARIIAPDQPPEVLVDGRPCPVIGTTRSGWLSTAGLGWCCFCGDRDTLATIGKACTPVRSQLMADRKRFNAALHRYASQPETGFCAGLPVFNLGGGREAIRPEDIEVPEVKDAFQGFLDDLGPDLEGRLVGDLRVTAMPDGYADSTLWWWFAREWKGKGR
ncbi:hypothetical protein [Paenirhodobacter populi]|uniref:Uncharacterized protein n=1 Tax=Paenirhodobacter populi TaxID=2306993 RepID=A0A443J6A6_9RHOB|nr:hypothetical protein [Sinirhodobacter populi]RWR16075.1 hypothetical protein D2T30_22455 [Sinirhodobacter populi]